MMISGMSPAAGGELDAFAAAVVHELRNAVSPLRFETELIRTLGPDSPGGCRAFDRLERQIGHLGRVLEGMFDLYQVRDGHASLETCVFDLCDVVAGAVEEARPLILGRCHRLTTHVPDDARAVCGDPDRVEQVLTNLLVNAAKYTPCGGDIDLTADRADADVCIRVRDTGSGIPADVLPHVFEPLARASRGGGLGLGLALVRRLVELHSGSVWAESPGPGRGSTFIVRFPLEGPAGGY
jgi:signal transduction histidine kinase